MLGITGAPNVRSFAQGTNEKLDGAVYLTIRNKNVGLKKKESRLLGKPAFHGTFVPSGRPFIQELS